MRRRPGTGTVEPRVQRDGSIRFMPRLPDKRRTPLGTFPTRAEAEKILDAAVYELATGKLTTSKTLDAYAAQVFDRRELEGYRSADTERARWKYIAGNPKLERPRWSCADWPVDAIKRRDVVAWTRDLATLGLGHSTRVNALTTLRMVFEAALDDEIIETNPAREVRLKSHGAAEDTMRPLTLDELSRLFWTADLEGKHLIAIAVGTGMRTSELAALRHVDVYRDDAEPHLMIRHGSPGKPRKNGKVHRVPLFGFALEAMRSWEPPANERGLFFATSAASAWKKKVGCVRRKGEIVPRKRWVKWLAAAGIDRRVRWHDLRHTCATLLLTGALGRAWSLEEICDLLGHSSIAVTERYAKHLNLNAGRAARAHGFGDERSHTEATRHEGDRASAREESRLRDLNSRPTVYEIQHKTSTEEVLRAARDFAVALLERAAARGDVPRRVVKLCGELLDAAELAPADGATVAS